MTLIWRTDPNVNQQCSDSDFFPMTNTGLVLEFGVDGAWLELGGWDNYQGSLTVHPLTQQQVNELYEALRPYVKQDEPE